MSVSLLLISHEGIASELIAAAETIWQQPLPDLKLISLPANLEAAELGSYADRIRDAIDELGQGDGVLVLTDLYGATPDNLARYFSDGNSSRVVSGINLPMLLRVLNYAHLSLEQLAETAIVGGCNGVQLGRG